MDRRNPFKIIPEKDKIELGKGYDVGDGKISSWISINDFYVYGAYFNAWTKWDDAEAHVIAPNKDEAKKILNELTHIDGVERCKDSRGSWKIWNMQRVNSKVVHSKRSIRDRFYPSCGTSKPLEEYWGECEKCGGSIKPRNLDEFLSPDREIENS